MRDIILSFEENADSAIFDACTQGGESDSLCLTKAANIMIQLFLDQQDPEGALKPLHKQLRVPASWFSLINMHLDDGSIANESESNLRNNRVAISIAQLIHFNAVRKKTYGEQQQQNFGHSNGNETPLPLYFALLIHSK